MIISFKQTNTHTHTTDLLLYLDHKLVGNNSNTLDTNLQIIKKTYGDK